MGKRSTIVALALAAVSALVIASAAGGAIRTVTFDDLAANTRVSTEYQSSHGVAFVSDPGVSPLVKSFPGKAHSGDKVGVYSCEGLPGCGEGFSDPQLRGTLTTTATSVSTYVGFWVDPAFPGAGDSFMVRIRAYNSSDVLVAQSPYVTVVQGNALTQQVTATAPAGESIAYFDVIADAADGPEGKYLAIDDVSVTTPDTPQPADFTLNPGQTVVDVLTGTSVDVPVDMNRLNGSNGDVSFSVSGLPTGMSASFNPNPVPGTNTRTTLTLTAAEGAAHSDQYTQITVTATPTPGAGASPRSITKQVRIRENCDRTVRFDYLDARSESCMVRRSGHFEATNAEVRINGLVVEPADDSRPTLLIDPTNQTIKGKDLTMPWRVSVASSPKIPIYAGPIDWKFTGTGDGPRKVLGFDISGIKKLNGLPVTGYDASFLRSGKATIKPTLRLDFWPFNYFGNVTTSATFTTDNDHGADFSGLELKLPKVTALALELKDVQLKWQQGGTWAGNATLVLRTAKSLEVGAGFGIKNGGFDYLRGSLGNLNKLIGSGIFLQSIGFEVADSPLRLSGSIGVSAGPSVAGVKAIGVGGTLKATLADPFIVEIAGNAKVADRFKLGEAFVRYSSTRPLRVRCEGRLELLAPGPRRKRRRLGRRPPGVQRRGLAQGVSRRMGPRSMRLREGHPVVQGDRRLRWRLRVLRRSRCHVELRLRRVHRLRPRAVPGGQAGARAGRGHPHEHKAPAGAAKRRLGGHGRGRSDGRDTGRTERRIGDRVTRRAGGAERPFPRPAPAGRHDLRAGEQAGGRRLDPVRRRRFAREAGARGARPPGGVGLRQGEGARTLSRAVVERASHPRPARDASRRSARTSATRSRRRGPCAARSASSPQTGRQAGAGSLRSCSRTAFPAPR